MIRFLYSFVLLTSLNSFSLSAQNIRCSELSKEFDSFINMLKKENYKISLINNDNQLIFETHKKSNKIKFKNLNGFDAKCNTEFKDNMYVRLSAYEICFNDTIEAKSYEAKINKIINGSDLRNEKKYDFVIRNENKLIYISTDARIFYESVVELKNKIIKITQNHR
ncbi:hypothetical protein HKT18_11000 [Flavobacterium sp. IMCC34852]|uniref:Uncharacterized protein n=1 Tax=Flavobacterium rivulicola TaxID=2732161 RepID=A0A7Y3RA58_9FLAO|nr:hypothetical protein [Flavobacterium sp. IMCC34852]NNT72743.1 hypothetical protein [Flavobacterium sp. IMCC34852]